MSSVLVRDVRIVTQDAKRRIVEGDLRAEDGRLVAVGDRARGEAEHEIDGRGMVAIPGLVNAHTHLAMTLFRAYGDDMVLEEWLRERIWPAEARLKAEHVEAGAALGMLEMVSHGITSFVDMYFFPGTVARLAERVGMRAFVGFPFLDFPTPEMKPEEMPRRAAEFLARWRGHALVEPHLAPHALYTCGPDTLAKVADLQRASNAMVHAHASETMRENAEVEAKHGKRPVAALAAHGLLGPRTLLAHCGWITKKEAGDLGAAGASVAHCPGSNMKLATGGHTPIPELLAANANVALGTDGAASNNVLDLFQEMKLAAILLKHSRWDARALVAQQALDLATIGGARAVGRDDLGSLEVGKRADFALVDFRKPHLTPAHDTVSHLAYAARGSDVHATVVEGRVLKVGDEYPTMRAREVIEAAGKAAEAVARGPAR